MLNAGSRVGDYEIEADLGEGGMAHVYIARHPLLDTRHAIKVLDPQLRANAEARQRFLDEARIQAKHLDHPGIVKVTYVIATPEHAALVMELVDGPSLESEVSTLVDRPGEIRRIMLAVLDAVGHAHDAGIIHRDLKPANVLLAGRGRAPKVTDFGIAKIGTELRRPSKKSTRAEARMGTLNYSSPEQVLSAKTVTPRSDIFSLGVMLYELATGVLPFDAENDYEVMDQIVKGRYVLPEDRNPGIDPVIAAVICRAIDPDPAKRFASCAEMADALRAEPPKVAATALPSLAPVRPEPRPQVARPRIPTAPPEASPRRSRDWHGVVAGGIVAVAVIGIGAYAVSRSGHDSAKPTSKGAGQQAAQPSANQGTADAKLRPVRASASSALPSIPGYTFKPTNLIDGNVTTSWQPSDRRLQNDATWVQLDFDGDINVASIRIANGFQVVDSAGDEFVLNSRIAEARVLFSDGTLVPVQFTGTERGFVRFDVFPTKKTRWIRLVVDRIHRGTPRSRSSPQFNDDLAISEIEVVGSSATD